MDGDQPILQRYFLIVDLSIMRDADWRTEIFYISFILIVPYYFMAKKLTYIGLLGPNTTISLNTNIKITEESFVHYSKLLT